MVHNSVIDEHDSWVKDALSSSPSTIFSIKHRYPVDTNKYDWVDFYLRDKNLRKEIDLLRAEKQEVLASPIHRDELKEIFKNRLKQNCSEKISTTRDHFVSMQKRDAYLPPLKFAPHLLMDFSEAEIDEIFSQIPDGVRQEEIEASAKAIGKKIANLEEKIRLELSPQNRWLHNQEGNPFPYPVGCRWTIFVEDWKKVLSRYNGKANIDGCAITSPEEGAAYHALELDQVRRLTPLREPRKR